METEKIEKTKSLQEIVTELDRFFGIQQLDKDPAMNRFIPMVYDPIGFDWKNFFEPGFVNRFNGLMIKGEDQVSKIWCISFPNEEVLTQILFRANQGDIIFAHHPINMECGDPKGKTGKGFLPVSINLLQEIKDRGLSFYACHAPLDYNERISTSGAIAEGIGGRIVDRFYPYGNGFAGVVCEVPITTTIDLISKLQRLTGLPYVDNVGVERNDITKVSIIAGGGGDVEDIQEGEKQGVQCHIGGEVTCKIDNERGRREKAKIEEYLPTTKISIIGISHAGSEFIVLRDQLSKWTERTFDIEAEAVSEKHWWR